MPVSKLPFNPQPLMGTTPDENPIGYYAAARCGECSDIHFSIITKCVVAHANGSAIASVGMSAAEARLLAAELLALAEVH